MEYGTVVNGKEVGTYDGIVRIIWNGVCKTVILTANGDGDDRFLSLDDCLDLVEYNEDYEPTVLVIIEDWTHGDIYRYGAYSEKVWEYHGMTKGFA